MAIGCGDEACGDVVAQERNGGGVGAIGDGKRATGVVAVFRVGQSSWPRRRHGQIDAATRECFRRAAARYTAAIDHARVGDLDGAIECVAREIRRRIRANQNDRRRNAPTRHRERTAGVRGTEGRVAECRPCTDVGEGDIFGVIVVGRRPEAETGHLAARIEAAGAVKNKPAATLGQEVDVGGAARLNLDNAVADLDAAAADDGAACDLHQALRAAREPPLIVSTIAPAPIVPPLSVSVPPDTAATRALDCSVTSSAVSVPPEMALTTEPDAMVAPLITLPALNAAKSALTPEVLSVPPRIVPPSSTTSSPVPEARMRPEPVLETVALWILSPAPVPNAAIFPGLATLLSR